MVVGVEHFASNPYDSKTLAVAPDTIRRMFGKDVTRVIVERGYREYGKVGESKVVLVDSCPDKQVYASRQHELCCRRPSGIEAIIGLREVRLFCLYMLWRSRSGTLGLSTRELVLDRSILALLGVNYLISRSKARNVWQHFIGKRRITDPPAAMLHTISHDQ